MGHEGNKEAEEHRERLLAERRWHEHEARELKVYLGIAAVAAVLLGMMYLRANDDRNELAIDLETAKAEIELLNQTEMTPCGRGFSVSEFEIGHPGGPRTGTWSS